MMCGSPRLAARASDSNVSLPAPLGPTTSTSRPGPIGSRRAGEASVAGAASLMAGGWSCDAPAKAPGRPHHRHAARDVDADQVGAPARRDFAAIVQPHRLGRSLGDGARRGRQVDAGHDLGHCDRRHQQARRHVIRRQDIEMAGFGEIAARDIAGMRAPAHQVGGAHQHADAGGVQGSRGIRGGRKFGDCHAVRDRLCHVIGGGVVVARQRHVVCMGEIDDGAMVARAALRLQLQPAHEQHVELRVGHAAVLATVVVPEFLSIAELALAGRVIHQRGEPHVVAADQGAGLVHHARHRDLAAQMQEMVAAQKIGVASVADGLREHRGISVHALHDLFPPDPQRIEHRSDAGGRDLAVVGDHCCDRVPVDLRPRHVVRLDMVGVELHQPGHHDVAGCVLAALGRLPFADLDDRTAGTSDPAALDHPVGQHQPGIGEDEVISTHADPIADPMPQPRSRLHR